MLPEEATAALEVAWSGARAAGALGGASISELWEHTAGYTSAVCSVFGVEAESAALRIVDVGSGAGVPGIPLAAQLPCSYVVSLDSSERRGAFARRAARSLSLGERLGVVHGRAEDMGHMREWRQCFDVGVARLLADPAEAAELLAPFVRDGGVVVVSAAERQLRVWREADLTPVGLTQGEVFRAKVGQFVVLRRVGDVSAAYPRRPKARARSPLF